MSLRLRCALIALLAAALPLCGYFSMVYVQKSSEANALARSSLEAAILMGTERLDDWFFTNQAAIKTLARIPNLATVDPALGKLEMQNFTRHLPWVRAAFFTDTAGVQIL